MNRDLIYYLSYFLLCLEFNLKSFDSFIQWIDGKIISEKDCSVLVNISLSKDKNDAILEIYNSLNNEIAPEVYRVILGEIIIQSASLDLLKKLELIEHFLRAKEKVERNYSIHNLDPLLNKLLDFISWCWSELYLANEGVIYCKSELEINLNRVVALLTNFYMDNKSEWPDIESRVLKLIEETNSIRSTYHNNA